MTIAMRKTDQYAELHAKLAQEVRSEPVEPVEDLTAGMYVFSLLSACSAVCALPRTMFAAGDVQDIRNVRANLARLLERLS